MHDYVFVQTNVYCIILLIRSLVYSLVSSMCSSLVLEASPSLIHPFPCLLIKLVKEIKNKRHIVCEGKTDDEVLR